MRHRSFRGFVQPLITHLKSRAAATSLSLNFKRAAGLCCHGEERKKNKTTLETQPEGFFQWKVCGCYFRAFWFCVISFDQELQQQLMIETRNLKKTRNFYQKLIQQERKNKGRAAI